MRAVTTAIVSDLHLGTTSGVDVARRGEPLARLVEVVAGADRVVFLGDLLELRERPTAAVLADVEATLRRIGEAAGGKQVLVVPGNHDHQIVGPALERARLAGNPALPLEREHGVGPGEIGERLAALMPRSELSIAYPGIWLRGDVYATHGHYLDAHLTVPRVECLMAAAVERYATALHAGGPTAPEHYEAILAPIYALAHAVAQSSRARSAARRGNLSRSVWSTATGRGGTGVLKRALVGKAAIPAAVAALNAAGLGPFNPNVSSDELRRAGLEAIGEVVARLGIDADYVIFGHTHRSGPLDGDGDEWRLQGGTQLVNSGSWIHEDVFVDGDGPANPYWPGRVVLLGDSGPPELLNVLEDLDPLASSRR
jgi:predicted phosphodiesterase